MMNQSFLTLFSGFLFQEDDNGEPGVLGLSGNKVSQLNPHVA
jgi:hypothetical protein